MASDYTLNWTDDTLKPTFILSGQSANTTSTSLTLTGKGSFNWGEKLQENLIRLLENFASNDRPPPFPTTGQLWFNAVQNRLKVYYGNAWHDLATRRIDSPISPGGIRFPGDLWYDTVANELKVYTNGGNWVPVYAQGTLDTVPTPTTPTPATPVTPVTPTPTTPTPTGVTMESFSKSFTRNTTYGASSSTVIARSVSHITAVSVASGVFPSGMSLSIGFNEFWNVYATGTPTVVNTYTGSLNVITDDGNASTGFNITIVNEAVTPAPAPAPTPVTPAPAPAPTPVTPAPAPAPTPVTPAPAPTPTAPVNEDLGTAQWLVWPNQGTTVGGLGS